VAETLRGVRLWDASDSICNGLAVQLRGGRSGNLLCMKHLKLWILAAALMTQAGVMAAQTVNWVELGSPSARTGMSLAYDASTKSTMLFGGSSPGETHGDTWMWRGGWLRLSPAASPSARNGAGMIFDAAAGDMLLFGGVGSTGIYLNDTWTWDGSTWAQQFPPLSPSPRNDAGMVYDAASQTVVLFGGANSAGVLGDTWTWNGVTKTWTEQNPAASPSARSAPMTYDAALQRVVLFGGSGNGTALFTDTWVWNGTTWTQQFPASAPSPRSGASMAYDAGLGAIVLFGGAGDGMWEDSLNDTWAWNGTTWTQIQPATVPPNRYSFGMDYDPVNKAVFMFGGYSSGPGRGDTWLLALAP